MLSLQNYLLQQIYQGCTFYSYIISSAYWSVNIFPMKNNHIIIITNSYVYNTKKNNKKFKNTKICCTNRYSGALILDK